MNLCVVKKTFLFKLIQKLIFIEMIEYIQETKLTMVPDSLLPPQLWQEPVLCPLTSLATS